MCVWCVCLCACVCLCVVCGVCVCVCVWCVCVCVRGVRVCVCVVWVCVWVGCGVCVCVVCVYVCGCLCVCVWCVCVCGVCVFMCVCVWRRERAPNSLLSPLAPIYGFIPSFSWHSKRQKKFTTEEWKYFIMRLVTIAQSLNKCYLWGLYILLPAVIRKCGHALSFSTHIHIYTHTHTESYSFTGDSHNLASNTERGSTVISIRRCSAVVNTNTPPDTL